MGTNNWGPWQPASNLEYQGEGGTPPSTGNLDSPQSPSGSVTGESAAFNYVKTITSTQNFVSEMVGAADEGLPFNFSTPSAASNVDETIPDAPTGSDTQQGSPALNAPQTFGGLAPNSVNSYRWE